MKKILLSAMFMAFALTTLHAAPAPLPFIGPVTLTWTVTQQGANGALTSSTTNHTGTGTNGVTNITSMYKWTTMSSPFGNADFLNLLENSFNTTFPKGSKLATDGLQLFVVDKTGSNAVLDISSVVSAQVLDEVFKANSTVKETIKHSGTTYASGFDETDIRYVSLEYDDSSKTKTTDGTHSSFYLGGLATYVNDVGVGKFNGMANVTLLNGVGYGTVRNTVSILSGSIVGAAVGLDY